MGVSGPPDVPTAATFPSGAGRERSSHLAQIGLGVLALALSGSVLLVVDVATGRAGGIAAGTFPHLMQGSADED
jgi:hypothetical protein